MKSVGRAGWVLLIGVDLACSGYFITFSFLSNKIEFKVSPFDHAIFTTGFEYERIISVSIRRLCACIFCGWLRCKTVGIDRFSYAVHFHLACCFNREFWLCTRFKAVQFCVKRTNWYTEAFIVGTRRDVSRVSTKLCPAVIKTCCRCLSNELNLIRAIRMINVATALHCGAKWWPHYWNLYTIGRMHMSFPFDAVDQRA